jgi:hypothetical protein
MTPVMCHAQPARFERKKNSHHVQISMPHSPICINKDIAVIDMLTVDRILTKDRRE